MMSARRRARVQVKPNVLNNNKQPSTPASSVTLDDDDQQSTSSLMISSPPDDAGPAEEEVHISENSSTTSTTPLLDDNQEDSNSNDSDFTANSFLHQENQEKSVEFEKQTEKVQERTTSAKRSLTTSRRNRFQVKPSTISKRQTVVTDEQSPEEEPSGVNGATDADFGHLAADDANNDEPEPVIDESQQASTSSHIAENIGAEVTVMPKSNNATPHLTALLNSPARHYHRIKVRPNIQPVSPTKNAHLDSLVAEQDDDLSAGVASKNKKFTGKELLDRATFTMSDLIFWNPKNGTALTPPDIPKSDKQEGSGGRKKKLGRPRIRAVPESESMGCKMETTLPPAEDDIKSETSSQFAAPQVKIGSDGNIILDETSLVIQRSTEAENKAMETVQEHSGPLGWANRRVSSFSFRKRAHTSSKLWTEEETERFFIILSATGTDFQMMKEFFPWRTRLEIKNKFLKEQKQNHARVDKALKSPMPLDPALYEFCPNENSRNKRKEMQDFLERNEDDIDWEKEAGQKEEKDGEFSEGEDRRVPQVPSEEQKNEEEREKNAEEPIDFDEIMAEERAKAEKEAMASGSKTGTVYTGYGRKRRYKEKNVGESTEEAEGKKNEKKKKLAKKLAKTIGVEKGKQRQKIEEETDESAVASTSGSLVNGNVSLDALEAESVDEMNTVATEGGGRILLVHEKSRVPGEPDMVHVYLLAPGADQSEEGGEPDPETAQLLSSQPEASVESEGEELQAEVKQMVKELPADESDDFVNVEI